MNGVRVHLNGDFSEFEQKFHVTLIRFCVEENEEEDEEDSRDFLEAEGFSGLVFWYKVFGCSSWVSSCNSDLVLRLVPDFKYVHQLISFFCRHQQFRYVSLLDLYGVDCPYRDYRYELHYRLFSFSLNVRLLLIVPVSESQNVSSISSIYASAGWLEREVWDLFGCFFLNNFDLRRILTDYGFQGHPLRKDFPLIGLVEVKYDDQIKKVVLEPVEFVQEYRYFDFMSPWSSGKEGAVFLDEEEDEVRGGPK